MNNEDEDEQQQSLVTKHTRPSELRRHGFGSPAGMEMTDISAPRSASGSETTPETLHSQPSDSSQSQSPPEVASATAMVTDASPSSTVITTLPSVAEGETPSGSKFDIAPSLSTVGEEGESPKKLRKRRLFFTPSRRKSKNTLPETTIASDRNPNQLQQSIPKINPTSPQIQQNRFTSQSSSTRTTPRPKTRLRIPGPTLSTRQSPRHQPGRRRQTGAPMPTGLSGFSTPRSNRRRTPTSSGRRGFNPLERISDIFSPQSPSFSQASPNSADVIPDDKPSDSSCSDSSVGGSVKEPFAEQVERLDQLLATPIGALAVTSPDKDYRSDDDLDDEVEGLESSRRLLAEELSRVDFSLIGKSPGGSDKGIFRTAESIEKSTGEVEAATPSLPKRKLDGTGESDIDWVPLLESEAHHAPNFSPIGPGQDADTTAGHNTVSPTRSESHSNATVYLGDEYFSPSEDYDEHEEEDKKPAAKPRQTQDKKMLDIFSRNDKGKNKKMFEGKEYSSLNSPTKTFRVNTAQGEKIIGKRNPTAEDSLSKKELDSISPISKNTKEEEILRDITSGSTTSPQSKHERLKSADDDLEDSLEGSPAEVYFPGAVLNPFSVSTVGHDTQSPAIDLNSVSGESSLSLPSSVERKKNIYQSFLSFAKRYNSDGRYLEAGETPTKNFDHSRLVLEHLNTIFTNKEGEQSGMQRNQALTSEEESSANKKEQNTEKQLLFTLPRDQDPTDGGEIGLPSTPQDSQEIVDSKEITSQEMQAESDLALQSSIMEGRSNPKASKNVSNIIDSKSLKSKDTPSIIPILNDDSDNDVLFHIDSPQSVVSLDIGAPAPGDNLIGLKESKITKNDDPTRKHHTSKSKWKRGLLIIGVLSLVIGLGLVIGTIAFPTREETQASTPSITLTPTQNPPIPSGPPSEIISFPSSQRSSLYPSTSPSKYLPVSPTPISSVPSLSFSPSDIFLFPSRNNQIPSNLSPPAIPSEDSSSIPTLESSEFQTTTPSTFAVTTVSPSEFSLIPSLQPSTSTPLPSSLPSGVQSENPSNPPSLRRSQFPSTSPSKTSSFPSLRPSSNSMMPSTLDPSQIPSTYPSTFPTQIRSEQPSLSGTISFTVPYKIFIANGLVEFVPQSEYIPQLTKSMDLLTDDILLNVVAKKKRIGLRRRLAEVVLPTSITGIFNIDCPVDIENSLCQEVFAKISLLDGEDIWQLFEVTTELAVEIGRLQYYLEQVDPYSPVEIIDALWDPETQDIATDSLQQISTSSPTTSTSAIPTSSLLLDFLGEQSFDDGKALNNSQSPQFRAYSWLLDNSDLNEYSEKQLLQRYSLATLYYATSGDQWLANTFWLSNLKECYWFGRTGSKKRCNKKGELIHLELDLNNLKGSLPPELGLLSSALESITLSGGANSDLVGTLPSELGHLTRLKVLNVRNNDLSGTIPFEIENLKRLEKIDLSQNRFRGEIPTQIGALSNLRFLDVSLNYLSGNLPTELGRLKRCQTVSLEDNILVSTIPTEIGKLRELKLLKAGFNEFALLPTELGALKSVDFISFQNCSIAGTIPTELGNLRKLRHLELQNNELSGTIPLELAQIGSFQNQLDLSYNQLSGTLPTELGFLVDLRGIKLDNNYLSGEVPSELSKMSKLTSIQLQSNYFYGTIPTSVCETFNTTHPAFHTDCDDFLDNCPCCTTCCVYNICTCRYSGTPKEFLCFQRK